MPKFMIAASYTADGVKGVRSAGGSARRDIIGTMIDNVGGTLEGFYFAFGDPDVFVIADLPDNQAATAVALAVNASGSAHVQTSVLLTPEEVDAAAKLDVEYRPPGT